jgi:hypothetical protein
MISEYLGEYWPRIEPYTRAIKKRIDKNALWCAIALPYAVPVAYASLKGTWDGATGKSLGFPPSGLEITADILFAVPSALPWVAIPFLLTREGNITPGPFRGSGESIDSFNSADKKCAAVYGGTGLASGLALEAIVYTAAHTISKSIFA